MTVQLCRVQGDPGPQPCLHRIRPRSLDALQIVPLSDEPFREQEAGRQLDVVARRPHRHRDRPGSTAVPRLRTRISSGSSTDSRSIA